MEVVSARLSQCIISIYGSSMHMHFHVCCVTCACRLECEVMVGDEMQQYWNPVFMGPWSPVYSGPGPASTHYFYYNLPGEPVNHLQPQAWPQLKHSTSRTIATRKKEGIPTT